MNNEIDYKKLYEEAQSKLEEIEYQKLLIKIDDELNISYDLNRHEKSKECVENKKYFSFLKELYSENIDKVIEEIGWEKLIKIIDDIYNIIMKRSDENE